MSTSLIGIVIPIVLIAGVAVPVITTYNRLVANKQAYKTAFSGIEVELKRRLDLIPNLLETAKKYMAHESETLQAVVEARNTAKQALEAAAINPAASTAMASLKEAEGALSNAMGGLSVTMEAYPDLKASETMRELMTQLSGTEDRIAYSRQAFNAAVEAYNTHRQSFPAIMMAPLFGHRENASLLEFDDGEKLHEAPRVSF